MGGAAAGPGHRPHQPVLEVPDRAGADGRDGGDQGRRLRRALVAGGRLVELDAGQPQPGGVDLGRRGQLPIRPPQPVQPLVQANLECFRDGADGLFKVLIKDCRQNASLANTLLEVDRTNEPLMRRKYEEGQEDGLIQPWLLKG